MKYLFIVSYNTIKARLEVEKVEVLAETDKTFKLGKNSQVRTVVRRAELNSRVNYGEISKYVVSLSKQSAHNKLVELIEEEEQRFRGIADELKAVREGGLYNE
ncbi:hypothetical protein D3C73_995390 [compost metagenome]